MLTIFLAELELSGMAFSSHACLLLSVCFMVAELSCPGFFWFRCRHDIKHLLKDETDEYIEDEDYSNMTIDLPLAYASVASFTPASPP